MEYGRWLLLFRIAVQMLVGLYSRHTGPDNKRMDIMRALIGFHAFEIHQMAHDRVIIRHTICAQNIPRKARAMSPRTDVRGPSR